MTELGYHLRVRLESDRQLHTSPAQRRALARAVYRIAAPWNLLAFGCAGVHLHLVALADRHAAGELARRLEIGLQRLMGFGVPFLRVHRKELEDQQHLFNAVRYDLGQRRHHELAADPCLEGTSAPDLLGARLLGSHLIPRVREHVPEFKRRHILEAFGLTSLSGPAEPAQPEMLRDAVLAAAALAAFDSKAPEVQRARTVFLALADPALGTPDLADLCATTARTVQRLRNTPVPSDLLHAARVQLALRQQVEPLQDHDPLHG
ncbi:MAG: hypothetical protein ABIO70_01900 [Pseudomonadota bacterium]